MSLSILDFSVIAAYLLITLFIGIRYSSLASQNTSEFFLSGRKQPWWLAGTGMVATTFAADTPLAVTGLVAKNGIAGNWVWWSFVFGGMLTVFFFARLWRRAQILTDLEFIELRYSGKPAEFLRGFKAVYFGLFLNVIIVGWVNLAMLKIITIMLPELNPALAIVFCVGLTALYSGLAGLWGVTMTDLIQFTVSMVGCVILAIFAVQSPVIQNQGGLSEALPEWMFHFLPEVTDRTAESSLGGAFQLTVYSFIAFVGIQWWASWYPGSEPGGGGYIAQRMMSAKDEKHSLFATLWFIVAHYCIRPWPWIIVGLVSVAMFPNLPLAEKEDGFIHVMQTVLPDGLRGLLLAAFLAAYMSTLSTHLNWGTSYLLNDFYKRFFKPDADERHFVSASKIFTVLIAVISLLVTFFVLDTITGAWAFLLECGAGAGFVLILRWFWWRLNAWSEITSMVAPFVAYSLIYFYTDIKFPESLFFIVGFTIVCTLAVTFLTKPESMAHLKTFYQKTRVGGLLWKKVSDELPEVQSDSGFSRLFLDWMLGIVLVYTFLFGVGKIIFGELLLGATLLFVGILSGAFIYFDFEKRGWTELD
ncbi:Na+/solute symporter [Chloroherpeton thalassium ATCC 35110]|uniref:Na+/solute symporter n=1 Tax=Chloroherpeton thalassium (strain ATCC 35110 / GB-78) TaxID=517418 RepID=B3QUE1_CHLT3|nr:sodium:solute symporter family protein [Chloroherpeton thalassium]ACF14390.1 Na+/solute symporter [Chloroherpeton thalassium ATCC 35110]